MMTLDKSNDHSDIPDIRIVSKILYCLSFLNPSPTKQNA